MATGVVTDTNILSDETFDILCSLCRKKNKNTEATKFCVDCQDYYCSTCVKFHDDIPALSRHKILNKDQFKSGRSQKVQMVPTERCDRHSHKHVDMYCQSHDDVGCSTCMAAEHRLCQDIFYIPEFLQKYTDTSDPRAISQKLDSTTNLLVDQHAKFQKEKERLLKSTAQCLDKMKQFRTAINRRLDELEQKSTADIEAKYQPKLDKLDEQINQIQSTKGAVLSAKTDLSSAGNNASQMFVSKKKGKNVAENAVKYITDTKGEKMGEDTQFLPDLKLMAVLKELNLLGQLTENTTRENKPSTESKREPVDADKGISSQAETGNVTKKNTRSLIKLAGKKQYRVRIPSDKSTCNIYSTCVLEDGAIILADHNNRKLKCVDHTTYTVTDYCEVSGDLYQVCSISNREVAVSCGGKQSIQFVSLGNKMAATRQIKTNHNCYGLAYTAGQLYISDSTTVYIYTVSGRKLQQFDKVQSGQELFSDIYSLAVSNDGSKIYVADWNKGIIALGRDGKVLAEFKGQELQSAEDVCVTENGSVLVCGYNSKNVLQLTADCELIGEVLKCDTPCRTSCYDARHSKLIVGLYNRDNIHVDVYDVV